MANRLGRVTHGHSYTRVYKAWAGMMARCYTPTATRFADWGGRGIKVCKRWHRFENFLADMGEPPTGKSLDRIENDKDYKPGNCRWATPKQQCENRRKRKPKHVKHCAICGHRFTSIMERAMYCSYRCNVTAQLRRYHERRKAVSVCQQKP